MKNDTHSIFGYFRFMPPSPEDRSVHIKSRITDAEMRAAVPMRHKAVYCGMLCGKGADSDLLLFLYIDENFMHTP